MKGFKYTCDCGGSLFTLLYEVEIVERERWWQFLRPSFSFKPILHGLKCHNCGQLNFNLKLLVEQQRKFEKWKKENEDNHETG